jgi:hypothetical protein
MVNAGDYQENWALAIGNRITNLPLTNAGVLVSPSMRFSIPIVPPSDSPRPDLFATATLFHIGRGILQPTYGSRIEILTVVTAVVLNARDCDDIRPAPLLDTERSMAAVNVPRALNVCGTSTGPARFWDAALQHGCPH